MLAETTTGTYIAIGLLSTVVPMGVTLLVSAFKQTQSYGRLENKVDASFTALEKREPIINSLSAETSRQSVKLDAISQSLIAQTTALTVLTAAFQVHQVQDAESFATLKAHMPDPNAIVTAAAEAAAKVLLTAQHATSASV